MSLMVNVVLGREHFEVICLRNIKIEIGLGHAINHTSDLQANTEVDKGHSADKEVHLKGKVNSIDEQKKERPSTSQASQAQPIGGDMTGPESSPATPPSEDLVSAQAANIKKKPPIVASSTPSKRSNLCSIDELLTPRSRPKSYASGSQPRRDRPPSNDSPPTTIITSNNSWSGQGGPQIPLSCSLKNQFQSFLADDDFTWDRETVQRVARRMQIY